MEFNPICLRCKHYKGGWKCTAFDIIPDEIINGDNPHTEPLKDQDNDVVFEKI